MAIFMVQFLLMLLLCSMVTAVPVKLLKDFFTYHAMHLVIVCTCSIRDASQMVKSLSTSSSMWVRAVDAYSLSDSVGKTEYYRIGVFLEMECPETEEALRQSSARGQLVSNSSWLVWSSQKPMESLLLRVDSDLTWATSQESGEVTLSDVYKVSPDRPLNITPSGHWDEQGLNYQLSRQMFTGRRNLQGVSVKAAVLVPPPGSIPCDDRRLDYMKQFNSVLLSHVQDLYNFSLDIVSTDSLDGLMELIQNGDVQMGLTSVPIRSHWLDAVEFAGHAWKLESYVMFRHPRSLGISDFLFNPFDVDAWWSSSITIVVIMAALRLSTWVEFRYRPDPRPMSSSDVESSWSSVMVMALGAICMQGTVIDSQWVSWRVSTLVIFLLAVLLNTYYSASMVTDLLLPPRRTITTLSLLDKSPLLIGALNDPLERDRIENTSDDLLQQMVQHKLMFLSLDEGTARVRDELFAFHGDAAALYPTLERILDNDDKCSLTSLRLFSLEYSFFPVTKGSELKEMLAYGMRAALERGLYRRQESVWRPPPPRCTVLGVVWSVNLGATAPAFLLLLAGLLVAAFLLVAEIRLFREERRRKKVKRATVKDDVWGIKATLDPFKRSRITFTQ